MKLTAPRWSGFRRRLRRWFRKERRDLPWRRTADPYRIWLAEVMLQQTRVAAVTPFYVKFLSRFPSVRALATARAEEVLRLWAGLGYYSRARNLHRAAKVLVAQHGSSFPRDVHAALQLPGVGRYTAAAVLSMAYRAPLAVLDGNVARVLARLFAIRGDLRAPQRWKKLQTLAQQLLASKAPGDWNQAMMELGATVCTPLLPRCAACPVSRWCQAYAEGVTDQLPAPRKKRAPVKIRLAAAVLLDRRGRTLLIRDPGRHAALFSRMWQFPAVSVSRNAKTELARYLRASLRLDGVTLVPLPAARHSVTFRKVQLIPYLGIVHRLPAGLRARTPLLGRLDQLAVSNATRKIAAAARLRCASLSLPDPR